MKQIILFGCIALALLGLVCITVSAAAVTQNITYQGVLTDASGNPLSGTYPMTFRLYNVASGGAALATSANASVLCLNGTFTSPVNFDSGFYDGRALWVGVSVGADTEMTPRQEVRPVPYAMSLRSGALIKGLTASTPGLRVLTDADGSIGIYAETTAANSAAIRAHTNSDTSNAVWGSTSGNGPAAIVGITSGTGSPGVYAVTSGDGSIGVFGDATGPGSDGVYGLAEGANSYGIRAVATNTNSQAVHAESSQDVGVYGIGKEGGFFTTNQGGTNWWTDRRPAVNISTQYDVNPGIVVSTSGITSPGVYSETNKNNSQGVVTSTKGAGSPGLYAHTSGPSSQAVYAESAQDTGVYGIGKYGGYFTSNQAGTLVYPNPGIYANTLYDKNPGVYSETIGQISHGVKIITHGAGSNGVDIETLSSASHGVKVNTQGDYSDGINIHASGVSSNGISVYSEKGYGLDAETGISNGNYGIYTPNNVYIGGKIELVGTVDPIIVERFRADPAVKYEAGDVVCLAESGAVVPCRKADDTNVVGVVGPSVDIKDGEVTVVIMGYRSARPDAEYVSGLKAELAKAEAAPNGPGYTGDESRITTLKNRISAAEQVTRQVVRVKADATNGAIKVGDLLTTSATPGHAMKAKPTMINGRGFYPDGTILGKAMGTLESGTGTIEVLVTLQ